MWELLVRFPRGSARRAYAVPPIGALERCSTTTPKPLPDQPVVRPRLLASSSPNQSRLSVLGDCHFASRLCCPRAGQDHNLAQVIISNEVHAIIICASPMGRVLALSNIFCPSFCCLSASFAARFWGEPFSCRPSPAASCVVPRGPCACD